MRAKLRIAPLLGLTPPPLIRFDKHELACEGLVNRFRSEPSPCPLPPSVFIDHKCARCVRAVTKTTGANPESVREQTLRRLSIGRASTAIAD